MSLNHPRALGKLQTARERKMKRRNVAPGALALNYLLSFNNKLHTSQTEAALIVLWGKPVQWMLQSGAWSLGPPGPLGTDALWEDRLRKEGKKKTLSNGLLCSIQVWELGLKLFIDYPGVGRDSSGGDDVALSPLRWPCCLHG